MLLRKVINCPDSLWVQVISAKYLKGKSLFRTNLCGNTSFVWHGILKTFHAMKEGFGFKLGSGKFSLWYDDWFIEGPVCNLVDYVHISYSAT